MTAPAFAPDDWHPPRGLRLLAYLRRFGGWAGLTSYARLKRRHGLIEVTIPQLAHPVWLRGGTSDRMVFHEVILGGLYECDAPPPRTILDGGANIGLASARLATLYPDAHIVAVEPDPDNLAVLRLNTAPYPNIEVVAAALWTHSGTVTIANPSDEKWALRVTDRRSDSPATMDISAITVDTLLRDRGWSAFDLAKIDVEGAEEMLFDDSDAAWIDLVSTFIVEVHVPESAATSTAFAQRTKAFAGRRYRRLTNLFLMRDELRPMSTGDPR